MGCLNFKRSGKEFYVDSDFSEESEYRRFEEEIGGNYITFNSVLPKICIEKDLISVETVESFILRDFPQKFKNAITVDFFHKEYNGKMYYDAKKLKLLLFLLTVESQVQINKKYYDKVKLN